MRDCCWTLSDQKEEHISCWPDDNDVFFELDCYTRRKILVLFHRNKSSQNPCLKCDTLYWLQVNQTFQPLFFFFTWSSMLSRHFFYICIAVADPVNKKAESCDPILQFTARYMFVPVPSQELDFHRHMLWSFFSSIIWKDIIVCFVDGFYFHHCLIFLSINNNFIVFGLCQ